MNKLEVKVSLNLVLLDLYVYSDSHHHRVLTGIGVLKGQPWTGWLLETTHHLDYAETASFANLRNKVQWKTRRTTNRLYFRLLLMRLVL